MVFTLHGLRMRMYGHFQPWKVERGQDCPEPRATKARIKYHISGFHK